MIAPAHAPLKGLGAGAGREGAGEQGQTSSSAIDSSSINFQQFSSQNRAELLLLLLFIHVDCNTALAPPRERIDAVACSSLIWSSRRSVYQYGTKYRRSQLSMALTTSDRHCRSTLAALGLSHRRCDWPTHHQYSLLRILAIMATQQLSLNVPPHHASIEPDMASAASNVPEQATSRNSWPVALSSYFALSLNGFTSAQAR